MKKIDYQKLADKIPRGVWVKGTDLDKLWKIKPDNRKSRVHSMVKMGFLLRKGTTSDVQYKVISNGADSASTPTTNKSSSLDNLIHAASKVGSDNEILKKALHDIKATIEVALENTA